MVRPITTQDAALITNTTEDCTLSCLWIWIYLSCFPILMRIDPRLSGVSAYSHRRGDNVVKELCVCCGGYVPPTARPKGEVLAAPVLSLTIVNRKAGICFPSWLIAVRVTHTTETASCTSHILTVITVAMCSATSPY